MYQNIRILTKIYKVTTMMDRRTDGQTDRRTSRMKIMTYIVINTEMYQNIRILTKIYKVTTMTDRRTDGQTDRQTDGHPV